MSFLVKTLLAFSLFVSPAWAGIDFDGADDVLDCASDASLDNLGTMSVFAVINPDTIGETLGRVIDKEFWIFATAATSTIFLSMCLGVDCVSEVDRSCVNNSITLNATQTVIATWDGTANFSGIHMYVNGTECSYTGEANGSGTQTDDSAYSFLIGNNSGDTRSFDGEIFEMTVYNDVLSAQEIEQLSDSYVVGMSLQISTDSLVAHWALDEEEDGSSANADAFRDGSANENNCTGDDGANNTGLTVVGQRWGSYP